MAALMHFEVSFGVWVLIGALGPFIAADLHLKPAQVGLMVATPLLSGAVFRIILGWFADAYGPRRVGTVSMLLALIPLFLGWAAGSSYFQMLAIGGLLGMAGASFAVALPLAASHFPPSQRGLALGIAGAGNSGTIAAGLLAPRIAQSVGWHATFALAMIPVGLAAIGFRLLAKEAPGARTKIKIREAFSPLAEKDCWRVCALYAVTFGGFVGMASYLPTLAIDRYGISKIAAGILTAAAAGSGSLLRPVGGALADRIGGTRVLIGVYLVAGAAALALAFSTTLLPGAVSAIVLLGCLGAGNGAVFQLVSLRFGASIGRVTGLVGAAGGLGGFALPTVFGFLRAATGSFGLGLSLFGLIALLSVFGVSSIRVRWSAMGAELGFSEGAI